MAKSCYGSLVLTVTLADLRYRYRQFLIAVVGAGVVLAMGLLLSGLVGGFSAETNQTVAAVGANHWVLANSSSGQIDAVGVFPQSEVAAVAATPGVTKAAPLILLPSQVAVVNGSDVSVIVVGVQVGGLGSPQVSSGSMLSGSGQAVVDDALGSATGSSIHIGSATLHVVGTVASRTLFGGTPVVYMTIGDAQTEAFGGEPLITAVVTKGTPTSTAAGYTTLTSSQVVNNTLDSLSSATSSLDSSRLLMWIVAGIIISALLYVSALQRVRDFAVLKALGSNSASLFGSLATQAIIVSLIAALFGAILSNFLGGIFSQPVAIPLEAYLTLPAIAVIVGLLSSLVALRRVTGADPASAFG